MSSPQTSLNNPTPPHGTPLSTEAGPVGGGKRPLIELPKFGIPKPVKEAAKAAVSGFLDQQAPYNPETLEQVHGIKGLGLRVARAARNAFEAFTGEVLDIKVSPQQFVKKVERETTIAIQENPRFMTTNQVATELRQQTQDTLVQLGLEDQSQSYTDQVNDNLNNPDYTNRLAARSYAERLRHNQRRLSPGKSGLGVAKGRERDILRRQNKQDESAILFLGVNAAPDVIQRAKTSEAFKSGIPVPNIPDQYEDNGLVARVQGTVGRAVRSAEEAIFPQITVEALRLRPGRLSLAEVRKLAQEANTVVNELDIFENEQQIQPTDRLTRNQKGNRAVQKIGIKYSLSADDRQRVQAAMPLRLNRIPDLGELYNLENGDDNRVAADLLETVALARGLQVRVGNDANPEAKKATIQYLEGMKADQASIEAQRMTELSAREYEEEQADLNELINRDIDVYQQVIRNEGASPKDIHDAALARRKQVLSMPQPVDISNQFK